jgi:hypothetical protein
MPGLVNSPGFQEDENYVRRGHGLSDQGHVYFLEKVVPLSGIAGGTGRNYILPVTFPSSRTRNDVVYSEIVIFPSTVLASIAISGQDRFFGDTEPYVTRHPYVFYQSDN